MVAFNCDLDLSLHCWVMGSAHHFTRRTFDPNLINIFQRVQEIWSEHKIQGSNSWPLTVTLTLSRHAWVMGSAHRLNKANIWPKFHENLSKGSGDMEQEIDGWPTIVTSTLSLHRWVIGSTHHLKRWITDPNLTRQSEWQWSGLRIQGSNWWTSTVTLTLSQHSWWVLHIISLGQKFDQCLKKILPGVKEIWSWHQIQGSLVTFNCDLDLKSAWLSYGFCTLSQWGAHLTKV